MSFNFPNVDFKSGGNAEATATATQSNTDYTHMVNEGFDVGVANPDIATDNDFTVQGQEVGAGAFGGHGGTDNVNQNINV